MPHFYKRKVGFANVFWISLLLCLFSYCRKIEMDVEIPQQFLIHFNTNGGSLISDQLVAFNGYVRMPPSPQKYGHLFIGWYSNEDNNFDSKKRIIRTTSIYAKWKALPYIKFVLNTLGGTAVNPQYLLQNTEYPFRIRTNPKKNGFRFVDWYVDSSSKSNELFNFDHVLQADTQAYARWDSVPYALLKFDTQGGDSVEAEKVFENNPTSRPVPPAVCGAGLKFIDWYDDAATTKLFTFGRILTTEKTIYAKCKDLDYYRVVFRTMGGDSINPITIREDSLKYLPIPHNPGSDFIAWFYEEGYTNRVDPQSGIFSNVTIFAKWSILPKYKVSFDLNGGTGTKPDSQIVIHGNTATDPHSIGMTKYHYIFNGWTLSQDGKTAFDFNSKIVANTTLYPLWGKVKYPVTFDLDYPEAPSTKEVQYIEYGDPATLPALPIRTGWNFSYWSTEKTSGSQYLFYTPITQAQTLYAIWQIKTYTITFNLNYDGSTGGPATQNRNYNTFVLRPSTPLRAGYTFSNWSMQINGSGTAFDFNTTVSDNFTLYAIWTPNPPVTVTFNENTGDAGSAPPEQIFYSGLKATDPDTSTSPTKTGYSFSYWSNQQSATNIATDSFKFNNPVNANTTLYATWEVNSYPVNFIWNYDDDAIIDTTNRVYYTTPIIYNMRVSPPHPNPSPNRDAFEFHHWSETTNGAIAFDFITPITAAASKNFYAIWSPKPTYPVLFFLDGGNSTGGDAPQRIMKDHLANEPTYTGTQFTKSGWIFGGWKRMIHDDNHPYTTFEFETSTFNFTTPITDVVVLYAIWTN